MKFISIGGATALVLGLGLAGCASAGGTQGMHRMHDGGMMGGGMMGQSAPVCPEAPAQAGEGAPARSGMMGGMARGQMGGETGASGASRECPPAEHSEHHPDGASAEAPERSAPH